MAALAGCAAPPATPTDTPATMIVTPAPPPVETNVPMDMLLDARGTELRARFGEPHATRRDGGAEVWNYEAPGLCRLNLVMQSVRRAPLTVVHAQARMAGEDAQAACLRTLEQGGTGVVPAEVSVEEPATAAPVRPVPARRAAVRPRRGR